MRKLQAVTSSLIRFLRFIALLIFGWISITQGPAYADQVSGYEEPLEAVAAAISAQPLPRVDVSPSKNWILLTQVTAHYDIHTFAQPSVVFAGYRFNPDTERFSTDGHWHRGITLISHNSSVRWNVIGPDVQVTTPIWAPNSDSFAFGRIANRNAELWIGTVRTRTVRKLTDVEISAIKGLETPCSWTEDSHFLLCHGVPERHRRNPQSTEEVISPVSQESAGATASSFARNNLLRSKRDELLFDYFLSTQPILVDAVSGATRLISSPAVYDYLAASPDGRFILTVRLTPPYSKVESANFFPRAFEVYSRDGKLVRRLYKREQGNWGMPNAGWSPPGRRRFAWVPHFPATLVYVEALDDGDPHVSIKHRDRVMLLRAPFEGPSVEIMRTVGRVIAIPESRRYTEHPDFPILVWTPKGAWLEEVDYATNRKRAWYLNLRQERPTVKLLLDVTYRDRAADPGRPLLFSGSEETNPLAIAEGDAIFLSGSHASATGERPFLDRFDLVTEKRRRVFESTDNGVESAEAMLSGTTILTRRESPAMPPNYYRRSIVTNILSELTDTIVPRTALQSIQPRLLQYTRDDGIPLSATLFMPPGSSGKRVPILIWAYPLTYADASAAGRVRGSAQRYPWTANDPLKLVVGLLTLEGYGVLWDTAMPIVGGAGANDTAVAQMVSNARAAVDKLVTIGVADPSRIAIAGHSYGATMTALLLANSQLFATGIAIGGRYNWTLTPTGFQEEARMYWDAPKAYLQLSPLLQANRVSAPLLLIHGDDDTAALPVESQRMYQALNSLGKPVRLVILPYESHVPHARESLGHVNWELKSWLDRYLKTPSEALTREQVQESR